MNSSLCYRFKNYPYGEPWREPEGQPWLYGGNERRRMDGINEYDFNARRYNPVTGNFTTWDKSCETYPGISPYVYCGGDPVNAVDRDGELIIFINGMHFGDGGSRTYWGSFFPAFINKIGDHRVTYYDGSLGGMNGLASNRLGISNHTAHSRYLAGKEQGKKSAQGLLNVLGKDETLKFISHSMGSAYMKGFIEELIKYGLDKGIEVASRIEYAIDLAPFQPWDQKGVEGITNLSVQHWNDGVAVVGDTPNSYILRLHEDKFDSGIRGLILMYTEHTIDSFTQDIGKIMKEIEKIKNEKMER